VSAHAPIPSEFCGQKKIRICLHPSSYENPIFPILKNAEVRQVFEKSNAGFLNFPTPLRLSDLAKYGFARKEI
jgi:hypothetical protein